MTLIVAIVPVLLTPLVAWLLMEFGPERSVVFVAYWLVLTIVFAIAMPYFRRRGRTLVRASVFGLAVALVMTFVVFLGLLFALAPRLRAAPIATARFLDSHASVQ